jgi:hypothetical protein
MIIVEDGDELLLITQPDHARFAAELLSLWRRRELREHPRREALVAAVREHDNGWLEADSAPHIDHSTGRPHDFRSLPDEPRREIWRRGVDRFSSAAPYTALLTAKHSYELHRRHRSDPDWAPFLDRLAEQQEELLAATDLGETDLIADYQWLEIADTLSLSVCNRSSEPIARDGMTARLRSGELEIAPFPLAGATTFEVPCRRIANRRYRGEADLAGALGTARWIRLECRCRPRPGGQPARGQRHLP